MTLSDLTARHTVTAWVAALWSGEYDKVRLALNNKNGFCVQGVLGDQLVKAGVAEWQWNNKDEHYGEGSFDGQSAEKIPWQFWHAAGLDCQISFNSLVEYAPGDYGKGEAPLYKNSKPLGHALYRLNDQRAITFDELGHTIYNMAVDHMGLDLPPKEDVWDLANDGPCDVDDAPHAFEQVAESDVAVTAG